MGKEKQLKYEIVRNCEPEVFTPLWELFFFIDELYPESSESEKISIGGKVIADLVKKGFIELHLGGHFDNSGKTRLKESDIKQVLDQKEHWFSELASEDNHVELYLSPLGFDVAIGKLEFQ